MKQFGVSVLNKYEPFSTLPRRKLSLALGDLNLGRRMQRTLQFGRISKESFQQYFQVVLLFALSKAVTVLGLDKTLMYQTRKTPFDLSQTVEPKAKTKGVPLCIGLKVSTHEGTSPCHQSPEEFTQSDLSKGLLPQTAHTKRFEEQVAGTCPKDSNWFEFVGLPGGRRGTPRKIGWGCVARFPKPLLYL